MSKLVPNIFPTIHNQPYRIALIGEAPGKDEEDAGIPFVGASGRLLSGMLSKVGIVRDACFVGNVCQHRPPDNKIENFRWDSDEIENGKLQLINDIDLFKPNLCVLLGATPLRLFCGQKESIEGWRGTLFKGLGNLKSMATIHPAACLREYTYTPLLHFDLKRAAQEGRTPDLCLPKRDLQVILTEEEIVYRLHRIRENKTLVSIDIEGGIDSMSCMSFAPTADSAFIVPFNQRTSPRLWKEVALTLSEASVPKVLQNSLYDLFVLQYSYNIPVRGVVDDTMLKHWELYCELPKSLGFQTSIYTKEPFYKEDRHSEDQSTFYEYCCKDSAVTYEINDVLSKQLRGPSLEHYKLNLSLLEPLLYMELKGIPYDKEKANKKLKEFETTINRLQWALNQIAGLDVDWSKRLEFAKERLCFVRTAHQVATIDDVVKQCKTTELHNGTRFVELAKTETPDLGARGELATLLGLGLNVESKKQLADFLYRGLNLPVQYKKEHGRKTEKETTDALALLTLYKATSNEVLKLILLIRGLRTRCDTLRASTDKDGRIRCAYNIVGTDTGRLSCYESPTGSGFNLQTVTKKDRDLFLPDTGWFMFQCDLSGADGWTVAAHSASLGDRTMLEDYQFGLKPANILALMYLHGTKVCEWTREKLKAEAKSVDKEGWLYFACKRVQHGSNYGMKERTMSDQILKDSYKLLGEPILVEPKVCANLQFLYFQRYVGVLLWHERIKRQLKEHGTLTSASGHKRIFFGRRDDYDTFKAACSDEPQNNTTYAIKLALKRLWTDPENRTYLVDRETETSRVAIVSGTIANDGSCVGVRSDQVSSQEGQPLAISRRGQCTLRVQPLHTVHDSLNGQFRCEDSEWARNKIKEWFNNPITIAGQQITIPFEGAYGKSWGELNEGSI